MVQTQTSGQRGESRAESFHDFLIAASVQAPGLSLEVLQSEVRKLADWAEVSSKGIEQFDASGLSGLLSVSVPARVHEVAVAYAHAYVHGAIAMLGEGDASLECAHLMKKSFDFLADVDGVVAGRIREGDTEGVVHALCATSFMMRTGAYAVIADTNVQTPMFSEQFLQDAAPELLPFLRGDMKISRAGLRLEVSGDERVLILKSWGFDFANIDAATDFILS